MKKGQTIVEFALVAPILFMVIGSALELGFWQIDKAHQDRVTSLIANYIAQRANDDSSWNSFIESQFKDCTVTITEKVHDVINVKASCPNRWQGLSPFLTTPDPTTSSEDAVPIILQNNPVPSVSLLPGASGE